MPARGRYAKGIAKREEILDAVLDVIARNGYRGASLREIAEAVGLSQAGLLHHFTSKDELFREVLRRRDELDARALDGEGGIEAALVRITRHNAEVPGLVELYSQLSTSATDRDAPSREFFAERYRWFRETFSERYLAEHGGDPADATRIATLVAAVMDGLQTQWLLDRELDMVAHLELFLGALTRSDAR